MTMRKLWIALAAAVLLFSASRALADGVTNTFTGVVAGDAGTTNDFGNYFGGGSVVGDTFTLTTTMNAALVSGQIFVTGGTYYSGPTPITAILTINGISQMINDSGDAFSADLGGGSIEAFQQAFDWINQAQSPGVFIDLSTAVPGALGLGTPLPTMFLSNGDFLNNGAGFTDGALGENLDLTVETVNVPEPSSLVLLIAGLVAVALIWRRQVA
jgi:PEP-CTERM motif